MTIPQYPNKDVSRRERQKAINKKSYLKNREKAIKDARKWAVKNADKVHKYQVEYRNLHKKEARAWSKKMYHRKKTEVEFIRKKLKQHLQYNYGLSIEEYDKMMGECNNSCLICKKQVKLCIDHNHETGKIRGLLCKKCNTMIGMAGDSILLLQAAIGYLQSNNQEVAE